MHAPNHWGPEPAHLLEALCDLAEAAGRAVMEVYATDFAVRGKDDASPVTEADERAEAIITEGLLRLAPQIPIVAEEAVAAGRVPDISGGVFWLVDPLDGTREFVSRNGEFTVNIALIEAGRPVMGVVLAPAAAPVAGAPVGRLYAGAEGLGAWQADAFGRRSISTRPPPEEGLQVVASRSHGDAAALEGFLAAFLVRRKLAGLVPSGSSLKLCLLAAGEADLYPRLGRTMEWDIAAGDAVLRAAGGCVWRMDNGQPLDYGKPGFENPHFWAGRPELAAG